MPAKCTECSFFDTNALRCTSRGRSPLRRCVNAYVPQLQFKAGGNILEIGCGNQKLVHNRAKECNAHWVGVDPCPTLRRSDIYVLATVQTLPFPDQMFDYVVAIQTVEHWERDYDTGIHEIYRVLRPAGLLTIDIPIGLHGHRMFRLGKMDAFFNLFHPQQWKQIQYEEWGKDRPGTRRRRRDRAWAIVATYQRITDQSQTHIPNNKGQDGLIL